MAVARINSEPAFPWVESAEDRRFRRLSITLLIVFMMLGVILNMIKLPEPEQKRLIDVSPRLAKLILEKKKVEPPKPVVKKPEIKKEEKKEPEKKKEVKKKEEPKPKPKPSARERAQKSGLLAAVDELADLRNSFNLDTSLDLPQQTSGSKAIESPTETALLSSQARQTSGGIATSDLTRQVASTELAQRTTTNVTSKIESTQKTEKKIARESGNALTRTSEEVELVFQKNKGAIFAIYNRALRENPSLQGKVVLELTIDPDGTVSNVTIVSSELSDKALERKLVLRVKKFKFAKANVARVTVSYPIDFLPS